MLETAIVSYLMRSEGKPCRNSIKRRQKRMKPEHPSANFGEDRTSKDVLTRPHTQDQMLTAIMGGALPEQPAPAAFRRVLDVGCGTGGWLLETARSYPTIEMLAGVDVSRAMVEYGRHQGTAQHLDSRVEVQSMDALRRLDFPDHFFDLGNQRSGGGYLRTWGWWKILEGCKRVLQSEGTIRITEGEWGPESTSPALTKLFDLIRDTFFQAGHSFTPERNGVICHLERLLHQHGFVHIQ